MDIEDVQNNPHLMYMTPIQLKKRGYGKMAERLRMQNARNLQQLQREREMEGYNIIKGLREKVFFTKLEQPEVNIDNGFINFMKILVQTSTRAGSYNNQPQAMRASDVVPQNVSLTEYITNRIGYYASTDAGKGKIMLDTLKKLQASEIFKNTDEREEYIKQLQSYLNNVGEQQQAVPASPEPAKEEPPSPEPAKEQPKQETAKASAVPQEETAATTTPQRQQTQPKVEDPPSPEQTGAGFEFTEAPTPFETPQTGQTPQSVERPIGQTPPQSPSRKQKSPQKEENPALEMKKPFENTPISTDAGFKGKINVLYDFVKNNQLNKNLPELVNNIAGTIDTQLSRKLKKQLASIKTLAQSETNNKAGARENQKLVYKRLLEFADQLNYKDTPLNEASIDIGSASSFIQEYGNNTYEGMLDAHKQLYESFKEYIINTVGMDIDITHLTEAGAKVEELNKHMEDTKQNVSDEQAFKYWLKSEYSIITDKFNEVYEQGNPPSEVYFKPEFLANVEENA